MMAAPRQPRINLIAPLVIAAVALIIFAPPLVKNEIFTFRDHTDYFSPMRLYTSMHLRAGRLPLWNPYSGSGEQWLANPQTGVFYPPTWLFVVLPFSAAYDAYLLLHSLILGAGAYLLFRRSAGMAAALAGTAAVMLSGPVMSLLDVQNNFTTFAWLPWIIWSAQRDRDSGVVAPRLSAALLALSFLAGEPVYAAVAAVIYVCIVRRPLSIAIAAAGAAGLSAIQLLPFVDMLIGSDRFGGFVRSDILKGSMTATDWVRFAIPARVAHLAPQSEHFVPVLYAGVIVLVLAIAGVVVTLRERRRATAAAWLLLFAVAAFVSSGPEWIASLPLTLFRYPSRFMPFAILAVAAFAVAGWQRLRRGSAVVDAILIAAIVFDLAIAARPLLATAPFGRRMAYPPEIGRSEKILQLYGAQPMRTGDRAAWLAGYLNLYDRRFEVSTAAPLAPRAYTKVWTVAQTNLQLARRMAVGYVLVGGTMPPPFTLVARAGEVRTYRVPATMPMAYVRAGSKVIPPRALSLDASSARVKVDTPAGGLLVLTQNEVRGWRVLVDGRSAEKKLELGTFRAVEVPPGAHDITWFYRPMSLIVGSIATALALLWMILGVLRAKRSRDAHA